MTFSLPHEPAAPVLLIDGSSPTWRSYWRELCAFREVARMLVRRDLIVRFRQTYFGLAWLLFKPLMLMAVMSFAFGFLAGFQSNHPAPYPLIIFCGVIPWYFFSNAVPDSMNSLVHHLNIVQKTYFPRAIIPLAAIAINGIEFMIAWLLFVLGSLWFGYLPGWQVIFFPLICFQLILLCSGIGLWLALLNLRFRDIGNLVPFLLTIGFFVTPAGYTLNRIPGHWQLAYAMNPLVGIIESLRWCLLRGMDGFPWHAEIISLLITLAISLGAVRYFVANEGKLVDMA